MPIKLKRIPSVLVRVAKKEKPEMFFPPNVSSAVAWLGASVFFFIICRDGLTARTMLGKAVFGYIVSRTRKSVQGAFLFWIMKISAAQENNFWRETSRRQQSRRCEATRRRNIRVLVRKSGLNWGFGQQLWRFNETVYNHPKSCLDLFSTPTPSANKHSDWFFFLPQAKRRLFFETARRTS